VAKKTPKVKKHKIEAKFKIENIVASANLGVELDLYAIAQKVPDVEYEPEQFPGAILKLKDPRASLLLFKNGKVICTGSKSEAEVKHALERAIKVLMLE
jgi:transcription initiation factor TFIID TATA-box-binding protein